MKSHISKMLIVVLLVSGCTGLNVDRALPNFSESKYETDLTDCRGRTGFTSFLFGAGGALAGAVIGAGNGAYYGAITGGVSEGAIIGSLAGMVIGLGAGSVGAVIKNSNKVDSCLRGKGYGIEKG